MKQRSSEIDLTKGILTIGMVFAHVIQFLGDGQSRLLYSESLITVLVSFSGFLFCFGFASWIAYLQSPKLPWSNIIKTIFKCYFAFLISGVAFRILSSSEKASLDLVVKIAAIRDIPRYSEFLLSFAMITAVGAVFQKAINLSTSRWQYLLLSVMVCLAFTLLPREYRYDPLIGQFIGGQGFDFYPIIQYLPLYLLGIFSARYPQRFGLRLYAITSIGGALLFIGLIALNIPVTRFPPSAGLIICSAGLFYIYYGFAHIVHAKFPDPIKTYINAVGQNVLTYLLLSNLVLFTCDALGLKASLNAPQILVFFISLMIFIFFVQFISVDLNSAKQSINRTI